MCFVVVVVLLLLFFSFFFFFFFFLSFSLSFSFFFLLLSLSLPFLYVLVCSSCSSSWLSFLVPFEATAAACFTGQANANSACWRSQVQDMEVDKGDVHI